MGRCYGWIRAEGALDGILGGVSHPGYEGVIVLSLTYLEL